MRGSVNNFVFFLVAHIPFCVALWMISLYGEGGGCVLGALLYGGDLLGGGSVDADVSICVKGALFPPPPSPLLREALLVGAEVADASRCHNEFPPHLRVTTGDLISFG